MCLNPFLVQVFSDLFMLNNSGMLKNYASQSLLGSGLFRSSPRARVLLLVLLLSQTLLGSGLFRFMTKIEWCDDTWNPSQSLHGSGLLRWKVGKIN